jgi:hypothetical protein
MNGGQLSRCAGTCVVCLDDRFWGLNVEFVTHCGVPPVAGHFSISVWLRVPLNCAIALT